MPERSILNKSQIADLELIQRIGYKDLTKILKRLNATIHPPLSPSALCDLMRGALSPARQADASDAVSTLAHVLLGIGSFLVRGIDPDTYLDAISSDLESEWAAEPTKIEQWNLIRPVLSEMLSVDAVRITIKTLDLSYEYANLLQSSRIMTDVRPIFNDEGDEIQGGVVSFTLRLNLLNAGQPKSLSIALDGIDLDVLLEQCQKAQRKAETALRRFSSKDLGITLKIAGLEEHRDKD